MAPEVIIWADGSCPVPNGPGGHAAILLRVTEHGEVLGRKNVCGYSTETTNNKMELMAVIAGLEALTRPCRVKVIVDSKYVMLGFADDPEDKTPGRWVERWQTNGWKTSGKPRKDVKNRDLWERLSKAVKAQTSVEWEHVRGHTGVELNEEADRLAAEQTRTALDERMFTPST